MGITAEAVRGALFGAGSVLVVVLLYNSIEERQLSGDLHRKSLDSKKATFNPSLHRLVSSVSNPSAEKVKLSYYVFMPDSSDIETSQFTHIDGSSKRRHKRRVTYEQFSQTSGETINVEPGDSLNYEVDYITNALLSAADGDKVFHKVAVDVRSLSNEPFIGDIATPDYPQSYPNGADIAWNITCTDEFVITLDVADYDIEECCDRLTVYDTGGAVLGVVSGSYNTVDAFTSTGPNMYVRFTSDCTGVGRGFNAQFDTSMQATATTESPTTTEGNQVPGTDLLTDQDGYIQSPNYPNMYPANSETRWLISPNFATANITLFVEEFDTRENGDTLYVYDGNSTSARMLAALSGYEYNGFEILGTTDQMLLRFVTRYQSQNEDYRGFSIWYFASGMSACEGGVFLRAFAGNITTPDFPSGYPTHADCIWSVRTEAGTRVVFTVSTFSLESNYDFLNVYDGLYNTSADNDDYLYEYTGSLGTGFKIQTSGNEAYLRFTSDGSVDYTGFNLTYDGVSGQAGPCANEITDNSIASPGYPGNYGDDLNCTWQIATANGTVVEMVVQDFSTEFGDDVLFVFDGPKVDYDRLLVDLTGGNIPPAFTFHSSSNVVTMLFRTDVDGSGTGFSISYSGENPNTVPTVEPDVLMGDACSDGAGITGTHGEIYSPSYPSNYPSNEDCGWWVRVPVANTVLLTVDYFHTENRYDFLNIYDGNGEFLTRWTGSYMSGTQIQTLTNIAYLHFESDSTVAYGGFQLTFDAVSGEGSGSGGSGDGGSGFGRLQKGRGEFAVPRKTRAERIRQKHPRASKKSKLLD